MKKINSFWIFFGIAFIIGTIFVSCNDNLKKPPLTTAEFAQNIPAVVDSVKLLKDSIAVLNMKYYIQIDSVRIYRDSVLILATSMRYSEFDAKFRIARIKRYIAICDKNPSQKKFIFGWVKRAVR